MPHDEVGDAANEMPGAVPPVDADPQGEGGRGATSEEVPEPNRTVIHGNEVGGDFHVANTIYSTKYFTQLAHLQPHPVTRAGIIPREVFEAPAEFDDARKALTTEPGSSPGSGVLVLVAEPGIGARTQALRLLDECLPEDGRVFELFPDWEEPDVKRIPSEENTGYVLNLVGESEVLSETFRDRLGEYGATAREQGTRLIVLTDVQGWGSLIPGVSFPAPPLVVMRVGRPSIAGITERRLKAQPGTAHRVSWLHDDDSVFRKLLSPTTAPRAAVHLAEIISKATDHKDTQARDEYLGWQDLLKTWFGGGEPSSAAPRALRISTAVLDGCPSLAVLDAADLLLGAREIAWQQEKGGVLGGPDAETRCRAADIAFRSNGTVSLSENYPGINEALLQHVWHTRPQLVPVLTRWLGRISTVGGPAATHLDRLAKALTSLAPSQGPGTILDLVEKWVTEEKQRDLAVRVLEDLAVHPQIGAAVRRSLGNWAKAGSKKTARQQAVAAVCGRRFGKDFTRVALNRLRDVLDKSGGPGPEQEALRSLRALLSDQETMARTLDAIVDWAKRTGGKVPSASASAFVRLLTLPHPHADGSPEPDEPDGALDVQLAQTLLTLEGAAGEAVRELLRKGWRLSWRDPALRSRASLTLDSWCRAVERDALPFTPFREVAYVIFDEEANCLGDDLNRIIGGDSPLRRRLRFDYTETIRRTRGPEPNREEGRGQGKGHVRGRGTLVKFPRRSRRGGQAPATSPAGGTPISETHHRFGCRLRSASPGLWFTADVAYAFTLPPDLPDPPLHPHALARSLLRTRAGDRTATFRPLEVPEAEDAVNACLSELVRIDPRITIRASVRLTLDPTTGSLARQQDETEQRLIAVDHDETVRLDLLRARLLDPSLGLVWWLDRHAQALYACETPGERTAGVIASFQVLRTTLARSRSKDTEVENVLLRARIDELLTTLEDPRTAGYAAGILEQLVQIIHGESRIGRPSP